jgi:lysozyme
MKRLIAMLQRHEGLRLKPYKCTAGKLSIGYGRNLDDMGISEVEAMVMLRNDIEQCYRELEMFSWFSDLDQVRQEALVDMLFNLGLPTFLEFKKTLKHVAEHSWSMAAAEMLNSKWARQVGSRAEELAYMIETGTYLK